MAQKDRIWSAPQGAPSPADWNRLELAVNWFKGLHPDGIVRNLNVAGDERLILHGTQTVPLGVTLTVVSGGSVVVV